MRGEAGDIKVLQPDGTTSSIKPDIFDKTYSEVSPGVYEKSAIVRAQQLVSDTVVNTLEGIGTGKRGDWMVTGPNGEKYIIASEAFNKLYKANETPVNASAFEFKKQGTVEAVVADAPFDWVDWQGNAMRGEAGDIKVTQPDGTTSSIKPDIFEKTYSEVSPGEYEKSAIVRAQQLVSDTVVNTLEGIGTGKRGDWMVTGPNGEKYIIASEAFNKLYRAAPAQSQVKSLVALIDKNPELADWLSSRAGLGEADATKIAEHLLMHPSEITSIFGEDAPDPWKPQESQPQQQQQQQAGFFRRNRQSNPQDSAPQVPTAPINEVRANITPSEKPPGSEQLSAAAPKPVSESVSEPVSNPTAELIAGGLIEPNAMAIADTEAFIKKARDEGLDLDRYESSIRSAILGRQKNGLQVGDVVSADELSALSYLRTQKQEDLSNRMMLALAERGTTAKQLVEALSSDYQVSMNAATIISSHTSEDIVRLYEALSLRSLVRENQGELAAKVETVLRDRGPISNALLNGMDKGLAQNYNRPFEELVGILTSDSTADSRLSTNDLPSSQIELLKLLKDSDQLQLFGKAQEVLSRRGDITSDTIRALAAGLDDRFIETLMFSLRYRDSDVSKIDSPPSAASVKALISELQRPELITTGLVAKIQERQVLREQLLHDINSTDITKLQPADAEALASVLSGYTAKQQQIGDKLLNSELAMLERLKHIGPADLVAQVESALRARGDIAATVHSAFTQSLAPQHAQELASILQEAKQSSIRQDVTTAEVELLRALTDSKQTDLGALVVNTLRQRGETASDMLEAMRLGLDSKYADTFNKILSTSYGKIARPEAELLIGLKRSGPEALLAKVTAQMATWSDADATTVNAILSAADSKLSEGQREFFIAMVTASEDRSQKPITFGEYKNFSAIKRTESKVIVDALEQAFEKRGEDALATIDAPNPLLPGDTQNLADSYQLLSPAQGSAYQQDMDAIVEAMSASVDHNAQQARNYLMATFNDASDRLLAVHGLSHSGDLRSYQDTVEKLVSQLVRHIHERKFDQPQVAKTALNYLRDNFYEKPELDTPKTPLIQLLSEKRLPSPAQLAEVNPQEDSLQAELLLLVDGIAKHGGNKFNYSHTIPTVLKNTVLNELDAAGWSCLDVPRDYRGEGGYLQLEPLVTKGLRESVLPSPEEAAQSTRENGADTVNDNKYNLHAERLRLRAALSDAAGEQFNYYHSLSSTTKSALLSELESAGWSGLDVPRDYRGEGGYLQISPQEAPHSTQVDDVGARTARPIARTESRLADAQNQQTVSGSAHDEVPLLHRPTAWMLEMWNKTVAANLGKPLSVIKGYYEAGVLQVDALAHPQGLIISSTESTMTLKSDVTVRNADGSLETLKAGTKLPNGMQISPAEMVVDGETRTITGGKLITTSPDGTVLKTADITGSVVVDKGQAAAPGQFVVSRPSIDLETGAPRIDTYTNKDISRWVPVEGKPGMFSPKIEGAAPIEVIKVPENYQGTFDVSYGGTAPFKPGDLIVREYKVLPDGTKVPAFRRISSADGLETYLPTDAASQKAFDDTVNSLKEQYPELSITRAAASQREFLELQTQAKIIEQFPEYENITQGQYQVTQELARLKNEKGESVAKILASAPLQPHQKERVLRALAEVREHFVSQRSEVNGFNVIDKQQRLNWEHTARELGDLVETAKRLHLTPEQTEDALLASMFSDAVKNANNLARHHIDGAIAANQVLTSHELTIGQVGDALTKYADSSFTPERVKDIVSAILETQTSPPHVMSELYGAMLKPVNEVQKVAAENIKKYIADPLHAPFKDTPYGRVLYFSPEEKALLQRDTGLSDWHINDVNTRHSRISEAILLADGSESYRSAQGFAANLEMRGPETTVADKRITDSIASVKASGADDKTLADARLEATKEQLGENAAYTIRLSNETRTRQMATLHTDLNVKEAQQKVQSWLRIQTGVKPEEPLPEIPFWNSKLKYPNRGEKETEWSQINEIVESKRSPEQQKFWQDNQYGDLNQKEITAFKFAQQIKERMVNELRKDPNGSIVDYQPVMVRRGEQSAEVSLGRATGLPKDVVADATVLMPDQVTVGSSVLEYVKVAPVKADPVNLVSMDFIKDNKGRYYFTDPDSGALKPIGTEQDAAEGYKNYKGYKVYKNDGSSYINDNFSSSHVPAPGMDREYYKQEIVKAQIIDRQIFVSTGKAVEEFNVGDVMVTPAKGSNYFVKKAEWDSLYAVHSTDSTDGISAEALQLPTASSLETPIGENKTQQFWQEGTAYGTIIREINPETGEITSVTVTDDAHGWSKIYTENKLQSETTKEGDKEFTKNYNYEHAQEVVDLPPTQKVVDDLNQDVGYQKAREIAKNAKVPEYSRDSAVDQAANQQRADRVFDQVFHPPYEGATVVKAEQATEPFTWTNKDGETVQGHKGEWKITEPDGSLATVIEPQFFDQAYVAVDGGYKFVEPTKGNRVDIFNGLPGSGKTTNINKVRSEFGSRVVESDDNKSGLVGFHQDVSAEEFGPTLAARNGLGAGKLLARSNDINDLVLMRALKEGYNVVLPGVGAGDPKWMINFIRELKASGREVHAHFIEIPPAESAKRVANRFKYELNHETPTGARLVQPEFMVTHGDIPRQNFDRMVRELFKEGDGLDGYEVIWNYGRNPRVLEEGHKRSDS